MEEWQALNWLDVSEVDQQEQILTDLLADNDSTFFQLPEPSNNTNETATEYHTTTYLTSSSTESVTNHLVSNVYSGPTIADIETALSLKKNNAIESTNPIAPQLGVSFLERGSSKVDNKYTLKIKTCNTGGDGMSDDGYKWRKYGQKSIKNSSNPRSYYRCTNPRCSAKKQVERSNEDPDVLIVTYDGLHLHFTYSHFLPTQTHIQNHHHNPYPSMKKPKYTATSSSNSSNNNQEEEEPDQTLETLSLVKPDTVTNQALVGFEEEHLFEGIGSQGLLEDMVPLMIRNPPPKNNSTMITWSNSSSSTSSSYPSSPPTSSSSFSWSPNCSSFDIGVISSNTIYEGL